MYKHRDNKDSNQETDRTMPTQFFNDNREVDQPIQRQLDINNDTITSDQINKKGGI